MPAKSTVNRKEDFFLRARAAIKKAAIEAREKAIETGTGIAIVRNKKVVTVSAEEQKAGSGRFRVQVKIQIGKAKKHARTPLAS